MIDVVILNDTISFLLKQLDIVKFAVDIVGYEEHLGDKSWSSYEQKFLKAFDRPVKDILNLSERDVWHVISEDKPLSEYVLIVRFHPISV